MLRWLVAEDSKLECELGEGPYFVRASRDQLRQALVNLAINSRDAMPNAGVLKLRTSRILRDEIRSVEVSSRLDRDEYVLLDVSDTGVGMDPDVRARVFDPFFTTKPATLGTGLGLFIVYGIVNEARGTVRVVSQPGEGARFELYFPLSSERPAPAREPELPDRRSLASERILLVEDENDLRHALYRSLLEEGYDVVEAEDGEAALKRVASPGEPFDLVISDIVMPGLGGIEFAERIIATRPQTLVLLISGQLNHPSLRDRPLPEGLALLEKPFQLRELREKVREVLSEREVS